jgi:hypothetical protein
MGIPPTENLEYMYHRADIQFWAHCDLKWSSDGLLKKVKATISILQSLVVRCLSLLFSNIHHCLISSHNELYFFSKVHHYFISSHNGLKIEYCDLKWGSDGYLKKVKTDNGRQVIAKLKLLLDLTQIISS